MKKMPKGKKDQMMHQMPGGHMMKGPMKGMKQGGKKGKK